MNKLSQILEKLDIESSRKRRESLISTMASKEEAGIHCFKCEGFCCTYSHNSMQVDPLQALELLEGLEKQGRLDDNLMNLLSKNIEQFRLDKDFGFSPGKTLRRFYTCPFFKNESLGCSISREIKPYGCLAFNANEKDVAVEGKCSSSIGDLMTREKSYEDGEAKVNTQLRKDLSLWWDKLPLPVALVDLIIRVYPDLKRS